LTARQVWERKNRETAARDAEGEKVGRREGWKARRLEGEKVGRREGWKAPEA
jgi:hypothetical protein